MAGNGAEGEGVKEICHYLCYPSSTSFSLFVIRIRGVGEFDVFNARRRLVYIVYKHFVTHTYTQYDVYGYVNLSRMSSTLYGAVVRCGGRL